MNREEHLAEIEEVSRQELRKLLLSLLILFLVILWSWLGTGFTLGRMFSGLPNIFTFLVDDLLPPQISSYHRFIGPTFETIYMSYAGGMIAVFMSFFLGVLSAENLVKYSLIRAFARGVTTFLRAIPPVVWAVLMVGAVGIGPFAGTLALAFGGAGMLGKTFADSLEDIDMGQVEALNAVGASWLQVFFQGVMPQFWPAFLSWSFYRFDLNIRSAAIVGLVGGGGLGFILNTTIKLFQFRQAAVGILWIFALILVVEFITAKSRDAILEGF